MPADSTHLSIRRAGCRANDVQRDSRSMIVLLAIGSLVLGAGYVGQAWARRRESKLPKWGLDEKSRRLERLE
jgi:hypothetical protein